MSEAGGAAVPGPTNEQTRSSSAREEGRDGQERRRPSEQSGTTASPDGGRAVPYVCAFCGEEDLRPVEGGRWHCRSCLRVFSVAFHGIEPASFSAPQPVPHTGSTP